MSRIIYPYAVMSGRVEAEVTRVRVDSRPLDYAKISPTLRTVALDDINRGSWQEAALDVRAVLPEEEIAYGPWSELVCVAVLEEPATNTRTVQRLGKDRSSGTWQGTVRLQRSRHRSRATLGVQVVAAVEGVRGRMIGRSEVDWVIDLHAEIPVRDKEIRIVESDFRDGPHAWLRPLKDAPWYVDASGDVPTVHLNLGVEGLAALLRGSSSAEKATAALVNAQIVSNAWETMFHTAVSEVESAEDGLPRMPTGWRESVLEAMLPDVLPGMSPTDALAELRTRREEGYGWPELQSRIQYAAALRAQLPKQLTTTLRLAARSSQGENR
ncbi:hypothetical protein OU787_14270 [Kitasatospora sp. YST-16]|uniref:hypothetical protein n=1 Tax=Kitasatospora sp. YST-16 TaxID=2998080 RepID=UPI0022837648|nr:hypothetical protein [Kitasatospora sp. YST-16]WAL72570.1 hypothetical protein OU787_14270 [Kitasatospora sp. YST-16]WNW38618.1 hypothetical protein RKE32_14215 [Streptomyces sp. Li-HN-5-13]